MAKEKSIYDLKLHEESAIGISIAVLRVPGGCDITKLNNREKGYFVNCQICAAKNEHGISWATEQEAVTHWNTRQALSSQPGGELVKWLEAIAAAIKYAPERDKLGHLESEAVLQAAARIEQLEKTNALQVVKDYIRVNKGELSIMEFAHKWDVNLIEFQDLAYALTSPLEERIEKLEKALNQLNEGFKHEYGGNKDRMAKNLLYWNKIAKAALGQEKKDD